MSIDGIRAVGVVAESAPFAGRSMSQPLVGEWTLRFWMLITSPLGAWRSRARSLVAAGALALVSGCATTPTQPGLGTEVYDPIEPVNRAVFGFNRVVDGLVLRPAAIVYGMVVPAPVRSGVSNFLDNLRSPVTFANDLLQGERERAGNTLARFMINTTFGIGGIFDPASSLGIDGHNEDLGQTLAVWGLGDGPFLMLPVLGPSNLRDLGGRFGDTYANPLQYLQDDTYWIAQTAGEGITARYDALATLDDLERNSLDFYAAVRAIYKQRRDASIRNGAVSQSNETYEDIFREDEAP